MAPNKTFQIILNQPEVATALIQLLRELSAFEKDRAIEAALEAVLDESKRIAAAELIGRREAYRDLAKKLEEFREGSKNG